MTGAGSVAFDFTGSLAMVTGAGRGIGRATLEALVVAGAQVIAITRSEASAKEIRSALPAVTVCATDLANPDASAELVAMVDDAGGDLSILVNNAGEVVTRSPAVTWSDEDWDRALAANVSSVFRTCRALHPALKRGAGASVVNTASLLSFTGGINSVGYAAAKGAVVQLTKALSNEWASEGIRVNAVAPGYVETDANADLRRDDPARVAHLSERIPLGRWGQPVDVAGPTLFLCSNAAEYITGATIPIDGGYLAW